MMKFILTIFAISFLLPFSSMEAQTLPVDEVVQRVKESREKTRDFSADLHQEKKVSLLREKILSQGKVRFKHPDKFYIEFFPPESSRMAFDGKTLILYYGEEKIAERYRIQDHPVAEKYLLFTRDPFQKELAEWKISEDRESSLVMEIRPREKEALFVKTKLWISKKDWVVTGMEMVEKNGDTTLLRYSNIKLNTGLTDSDFEIQLPKGVKITEIR
jgi:outer membrane lipoprotein carrier protein